MSHPLCIGCGGKTVAEIKDLGSYNEHKVPVWFCQSCNLSTPTMRQDRHDWVQSYRWPKPGFVYGNRAYAYTVCPSCNVDSMFASNEFLINETFPFCEVVKPCWTCYFCGFSDMVVEQDGDLWADMYSGWAQLK